MSSSKIPAMPDSITHLPQGCSNFKLHQLVRQFDQFYDAELAKAEIKTTQYSLLSSVVRLGPVRPGALAQVLKMQPSTLTRNLQTLVRAGWIEVGAGSDARSRSVTATDAGREKRTEARHHWKRAQQQINRVLGDAQVVALHAQLEQALALLAAHTQADEDPDHGA